MTCSRRHTLDLTGEMVGQSPSIQSFFPLQSSPTKHQSTTSSPVPGGKFIPGELDPVLQPTQADNWAPSNEYDECDIDSVEPGQKRVKIVGRIVNLSESPPMQLPMAAKGSLLLVIKDDTGALTVRLCYSRAQYQVKLGQLVAIWATYVSNGDRGMFPCASAPLYVRIFPEKDKSCHISVLEKDGAVSLCRKPLNYGSGLMSLKNFINGGFEVSNAKILVIVKSISARKKVTKKDGTIVNLVKVDLMDDTDEATISLWETASTSTTEWRPSHTVLLLSSPGLSTSHGKWLSLASDTFVDVDPYIQEAHRLRNFAERMTRRDHVSPAFPQEEYDFWSLNKPAEHVLYTLADLDNRARDTSKDSFEGYLSVIITSINMTALRRQNMLMCNECCGIPVYANMTSAKCKQCDQQVPLKINPRLIGKLVDESGCIASGRLVLSNQAWTQFLGRDADELVKSSASLLKSLEQRMLYVRVTLRFWWNERVGKLVITQVSE